MATLTRPAIEEMGFAAVGTNVHLSSKASFYNCANIRIGSNVRIDDFCVLSAGHGGIEVSDFVHIAIYTSLIGAEKIYLGNYCNLSSRVSIYSSSDDYSGMAMTNPMVPDRYTDVTSKPVLLHDHVIVGCGAVILPGAILETGVAIGALSLVRDSCQPFGIYAGIPARHLGERSRNLLKLEQDLLSTGQ